MGKQIIALAGSPRKRGDTGLLLEYAIKGARDAGAQVELINANGLRIRACNGCNTCYKVDGCVYHDDMMPLYDTFAAAAAFIISSPVYFGSVTAQLKTVIDRCQAFWAFKQSAKLRAVIEQKRPGVFLATAGMPDRGGKRFASSIEVIRSFGYALDMELLETVLVADTDRIPVTEDSAGVRDAYVAGQRLAEVILARDN